MANLDQKIVLDIASGSGYGSAMMARVAKKIYGVDINPRAIAYAKEHYGRENIEFKVGTGTNIPLPDSSVDVVVSHETIEHIDDYKQFLVEIKRVLRQGGQAIISTPNDDEYPAGNHFHLHQFKVHEFKELLKHYFGNVELYYQGAWIAAGLLTEEEFKTKWRRSLEVFKTQAQPINKSTYVVALCSDGNLGNLKSYAAFTEPWSDKDQRIAAEQRTHEVERLTNEIASTKAKLIKTRSNLEKRIDKLEGDLKALMDSKSWKITKPLRSIKSLLKKKK